MRRVLMGLSLCLLWAPARADEALRVKVTDLLSGYDDPVQADSLRALGDGVGTELFAIAIDSTSSTAHRERATYALGWFPTEERRVWLSTIVAEPGSPAGVRRSAIWALVWGWGDGAIPLVDPALTDDDVQLRAAAARALGRLGTPMARARLEARAAIETNPMVARTLKTALGGN